ncbi:tryptophan synthase subunit alpha [Actinocrispum wychmicini]|nr:tryptophan synthase subunit alpha [Actinocrispum wychmicini]
MAEFFDQTADGEPGLALFLNAGDPPLDVLRDLVLMLDEDGVDCLELAVPFPGSVTDGPVIRRSHDRALALGVGLAEVLSFIADVRPRLKRLRIALLADWSYSVKSRPLPEVVAEIAQSGADGLLLHAVPPRVRTGYYEVTKAAGLPIVTTCYHKVSTAQVQAEAVEHASAYLYLVAQYGRSGTAPAEGFGDLAGTVSSLRKGTRAPIAVGFGVKTRDDVSTVHGLGADAVIVGSAGVARVEEALAHGRDVVAEFQDFVKSLTTVEQRS